MPNFAKHFPPPAQCNVQPKKFIPRRPSSPRRISTIINTYSYLGTTKLRVLEKHLRGLTVNFGCSHEIKVNRCRRRREIQMKNNFFTEIAFIMIASALIPCEFTWNLARAKAQLWWFRADDPKEMKVRERIFEYGSSCKFSINRTNDNAHVYKQALT